MNHQYKMIASKNGCFYHFASLEFKLKNRELIYIVKMNHDKKFVQYKDFETGKTKIEKKIDHFSFHKDGTVHLVYKNKKNKSKHRDRRKVKNFFNLKEDNYAPLLIHSVCFSQKLNLLPKIDKIDSLSFVFETNDLEKFSIVMFSVGKSVNYKMMLSSHGFEEVFVFKKSKFLAEPLMCHSKDSYDDVAKRVKNGKFLDTNVLLGFTDKIIKMPEEIQNGEIKIKGSYAFNVLPSEDKILSLE